MTTFSRASTGLLLFISLASTSCQSDQPAAGADLNSTTPAVAAQAQKVQQLTQQLKQQEAVIDAEKAKRDALQQQLTGAQQNLEGLKQESQAAL